MTALIVMPTFNEAGNVAHILAEVLRHTPEVEILVVDDASPDGTGAIVDKLAAADSRIHVLHRASKDGLGRAYVAGFEWGLARNFELICEMDADGSHRPADLGALLAAAGSADLVIGSRWVPGGSVVNWPNSRRAISRFGNWYARALLGSQIRDITAGFRVYQSSALRNVNFGGAVAHGYGFQVEMARLFERAKLSVTEVPITFVERTVGVSKMSTTIVAEAMWLVTKWGLRRLFRG
ncbi:MAG: hypothetical protein RLZZ626_925 [Actinomycetota bacterium]|jgi:dolichol-phosphate mannosyltransferase